jgi:Flp pilus assembly protein TadG
VKRPNRTTRRGTDERGQTLVEFALVFPIFFVLLMGMIEFGLVFNALLSINFASRDGSLIAAEAGSAVGSDCVILDKVERAIGAPSSTSRITEVRIYKADKNGNQVGSAVNVYDRSGTMTCTMAGGAPPMTVPYTLTGSAGYPDVNRCNIQGGCGGSGGVDTIGVKITYAYTPFTPLGSFIGIGSTSYTLVESNAMRMEPVL